MRAALAGNPNAGKTTLFNYLTKSSLRTGNFHGVTTAPATKTRGGITFVDLPGAYSFSPYSMEEESAKREIENADLIINVVDCLTLSNSLNYTRAILAKNKKMLIYITKLPSLRARKGWLDASKLSRFLGVPVLCSKRELNGFIKAFRQSGKFCDPSPEPPFQKIQRDVTLKLSDCYFAGEEGFSAADRLFCNKYFSTVFFFASVTCAFFLTFHPLMPGALLKSLTEELICVKLSGAITAHMTNPAAISFIKDGVFGGAGGVLAFAPQLIILNLFLILLDESGITSALSFCTDGLFEKAGLSGRTAFSLVSGFGCTAAAIATTRGCSTVGAQRRTVAVLPYIPCGAKLPVFLTFLSPFFENPFPVITAFYFAGIAVAALLSALLKSGEEGLITEVAPICFPSPLTASIKLCFYLKGFIIKVAGIVTLFCTLSWFLANFSFTLEFVPAERSMLCFISRALLPLFKPMGVDDWRIAYAALCGFIAKENIAATISFLCPEGVPLSLSAALAVCTFVLLSPACVSAFSASVKEVGLKFSVKCVLLQLAAALLGGYAVGFIASLA